MNETELREEVKFLKSNWQVMTDTCKHIKALISLATAYLSIKRWPKEKGQKNPCQNCRKNLQCDLDCSTYKVFADNFIIDETISLCKLALLKKCEGLEKVIQDFVMKAIPDKKPLGITDFYNCKNGLAIAIKSYLKGEDDEKVKV